MKFVVLLLSVLNLSLAGTYLPLEEHMKVIDKNFKQISKNVKANSLGAKTLELAVVMTEHIEEGREQLPDNVDVSDRPLLEKYWDYMTEFLNLSRELVQALENGNRSEAIRIIKNLNRLKRRAHRDFKPDEELSFF